MKVADGTRSRREGEVYWLREVRLEKEIKFVWESRSETRNAGHAPLRVVVPSQKGIEVLLAQCSCNPEFSEREETTPVSRRRVYKELSPYPPPDSIIRRLTWDRMKKFLDSCGVMA